MAALEHRAFIHDRLSRRSLTRFLTRRSALLIVADRGNFLCGYALVLFRSGSRLARLYSIATAPELSGHGIGTKLLRATEKAARRRGRMAMRLEVRADNASARHLYKKSGYSLIGRLTAYYQDGTEALRLEKRLGPPSGASAQR